MKLSIVIPALNEEEAIRSIIERCLSARKLIIDETWIDDVEVIVVSDGSSDRTKDIASEYLADIKLIAYEKNRGYGAAIKMGFAISTGDIVSFLDADGTCDPLNFIPMLNILNNENADICIGNRLGADSKMPGVRHLGNRIYAMIVSIMGAGRVSDVASGMRVIRKKSLDKIYPLPDGLNFTPAMSCRAVLDDSLTITDAPISYQERVGKSKLSVVKDGFRFLFTILDVALTYRSFRLLGFISMLMILAGMAYGIPSLIHYIKTPVIEDWMIYRTAFMISVVVGGMTLFNVGLLSSRLIQLVHSPRRKGPRLFSSMLSAINQKNMGIMSVVFVILSLLFSKEGLIQYITTGKVYVNWSSVMAGAFFLLLGIQSFAFAALDRIIMLLHQRLKVDDLTEEAIKYKVS